MAAKTEIWNGFYPVSQQKLLREKIPGFSLGIWITGAITKKAEALSKNPKQLMQKSSCDPKKARQVYSF